jgi:DNA-binding CsgD family transcriptional regulator
MAHDVDALWTQTKRFFSDFTLLSGIALGLSVDRQKVVFLRQEPACLPMASLPPWLAEATVGTPVVTGIFSSIAAHAAALNAWDRGILQGCVLLLRSVEEGPFPAGETERLEQYQPAYAGMANQFVATRQSEIGRSFWQRLIDSLPAAQRAIVVLAAHGLANKEIADRLSRSEASVKFHLHQTYARFGLRNRAELALHSCASASPC